MANEEHLKILNQGVKVWNRWREDNPGIIPDLSKTYLIRLNLEGANLIRSNLGRALINDCNLSYADLKKAIMIATTLNGTDLVKADLRYSNLEIINFNYGSLEEAIITDTIIRFAKFHDVDLKNTDFSNSTMLSNSFGNVDLSLAKGLETVGHIVPSSIGIDTLYKSAGNISEIFLQGCGVPDDFITFIPSHFGIQQAIQFYSCFISYSTKDEEFARRLYSRMRDEKLRVWFAPEDIKGGKILQEQIEQAIHLHDRLLVILSEESMQSDWVIEEISNALRIGDEQNRRKLFPITIVDFEIVKKWKCFDSDTGKDLAKEVRKYYIPDFSDWKNHDSFEKGFKRLLSDLRAEEKRQAQERG